MFIVRDNEPITISYTELLNLIEADRKRTIAEFIQEYEAKKAKESEDNRDLTSQEAATYLGVKPGTLNKYHVRYSLPYRKGIPNYYRKSDLDRVKEVMTITRKRKR